MLACGNSDCGQVGLGEEDDEKNVALLTPLPTLAGKRITYVACGGISSVVCTADGRVFSWGCNDDGALGRPTRMNPDTEVSLRYLIATPLDECSAGTDIPTCCCIAYVCRSAMKSFLSLSRLAKRSSLALLQGTVRPRYVQPVADYVKLKTHVHHTLVHMCAVAHARSLSHSVEQCMGGDLSEMSKASSGSQCQQVTYLALLL